MSAWRQALMGQKAAQHCRGEGERTPGPSWAFGDALPVPSVDTDQGSSLFSWCAQLRPCLALPDAKRPFLLYLLRQWQYA